MIIERSNKVKQVGYSSNKFIVNCIGLSCFFVTISQLPYFVNIGITTAIATIAISILFLIVCGVKLKIKFQPLLTFVFIAFFPYIVFMDMFTSENYIDIRIVYPIYIAITVFFLGTALGTRLSEEDISFIMLFYVMATTAISISIYIYYFSSGDLFLGREYKYASKNSVSQIIFTGLVFLILCVNTRTLFWKVSKFVNIFILSTVLLALRSRATLVCLPLIAIFSFGASKNSKTKVMVLGIVSVLLGIVLFNDRTYSIFFDQILASGRDWNDLDSLSSGRYQEWIDFPNLVSRSVLTGIGKYKMESLPLSVLIQLGIPAGLIVIIVAVFPAWWGMTQLNKELPTSIAFLIISFSYVLNGLFEELSPFGPGVKCYVLWLLLGILYCKNKEFKGLEIRTEARM